MNNDDMWNTGWDPYESLRLCEHNIGQCVLAIQQGSELIKELGQKYRHQHEVIEQLMFQNNKLLKLTNNLNQQIALQDAQIQLILAKQHQ